MYVELIQNTSLIVALTSLYGLLSRLNRFGETWRKVLSGLLFGGVAIVGMQLPFHYAPGVIYDGRSIILAMAGLFGGGTAAVVSTILASAYRAQMGGAGVWAGIGTIIGCAGVGLAFRRGYANRPDKIGIFSLYGIGIVVHVVMLACQLLIQPWPSGIAVINRIWLPILLIFPAVTVLMGLFLGTEERRIQAELSLRKNESLLSSSQSIGHVGSWEYDVDKNRLTWSDEVYRIFGLRPQDFAATYEAFLDIVHSDDRAFVDAAYQESIKERNDGYQIEHRIIRRDTGEIRIVHEKCEHLKDASGRIVRSIGMVQDITDRKRSEEALRESEEKFRVLFEKSIQGILAADLEANRFVYANPRICRMLGYSETELLQLGVEDIHPMDSLSQVKADFELQVRGEKVMASELPCLRKDGTVFIADIASSVAIINGKKCLMGFFADVSDRIRAVEEKAKLDIQLRQFQKFEAIGTLAGGIAHDFNNLLMGIQGRASLISLDLEASHPHRGHINAIEEYIRSATNLTKQLLGLARGGKYEVKPIDINELVLGSSAMFGRTKKEIQIHTKCQESSLVVEADRGQIEQVLLNMYINAWQAMPPTGGDIYLETKIVKLDETYCKSRQIETGLYIKVSVTDTGSGMDETTRLQVFDPFFTTKDKGRGTGLGMASAYGIIKNHGGIITVYSEINHGTTFNIYLPQSWKQSQPESPVEREIKKGTENILLVDDEELIIDVGQAMLEMLGYRVNIARNGQEAIHFIMELGKQIDLVILDMIMPGMDGSTTFDRIREIQPDMPVILSSGYAINGHADKIMRRGCNGFIQKPYNISELSQKIRKVLDEAIKASSDA